MKRVDRPIRLYVLTTFVAIAYGLMPFLSVFIVDTRTALLVGFRNLPLNGSILFLYDANGDANCFLILVSLIFCIFSAAAAIWAFYGEALGRMLTLVLVTLDVAWWSGIVIYAIVNAENNTTDKFGWALQLLIPPFWLGFIWWNYTRPDISAFISFKSQES